MISLLNGPVYLPPHVRDALSGQICDLRNPRFKNAYGHARTMVGELLGAPDYAVFIATGSGTFGVELVLRSCLRETDNVLALINGTFSGRLADAAHLTGANVRRRQASIGQIVTAEELDADLAAHKTDFVVFAHVEPSTATQYDLQEMAAVCVRHRAIPIVDGVCAGFAVDVHCAQAGLGAYVTASQKGLSLPPGLSIGVVSPALLDRAKAVPPEKTGLYGNLLNWISADISFTPAISMIFALEKSLEHIGRETMHGREKRHRDFFHRVQRWARGHNLLAVPKSENISAWTLSAFYYPHDLDDQWLFQLRDDAGLELAPSNDPRLKGKYFRIGHLGDLPLEHLERGLAILDRALSVKEVAHEQR